VNQDALATYTLAGPGQAPPGISHASKLAQLTLPVGHQDKPVLGSVAYSEARSLLARRGDCAPKGGVQAGLAWLWWFALVLQLCPKRGVYITWCGLSWSLGLLVCAYTPTMSDARG